MPVTIFFGVPGSGKTTLAAKIVYQNLKKGIPTYSNVDIFGAIQYTATDLGNYNINNADLIIDEAGIEFNNRKYKTLPQSTIEWFKYYRHYGINNIYIFSQSYEDMDITLRRLANRLYILRKSLIPFCFATRRINVKIGIDEDTHQIIDKYFFQRLSLRLFFGPKYWKMFNSWSSPTLKNKAWTVYGRPSDKNPRNPRPPEGECNVVASKEYTMETYKIIKERNSIKNKAKTIYDKTIKSTYKMIQYKFIKERNSLRYKAKKINDKLKNRIRAKKGI